MAIKTRHVIYAAKKAVWLFPVIGVVIALLALMQGRTFVDWAYAMIPIVLIVIGYFAYWLWRTQRDIPNNPR